MREPDSLDALLREWRSPEPAEELDQRVTSAYRSATSAGSWRRFWTMRISVPAPALAATALAIFILFLWFRPPASPSASPKTSDAVTQLNASGFQPLPNGKAQIIPAVEIQK
jgi:hypothetical protein